MGDRCYMQLTCKRKDMAIFEELGFTHESDFDDLDFPDCVEMVDPEANYGHADDLPTDIVYMGTHDAGGTYGPESYACDGQTYLNQQTNGDGGFVVTFDTQGNPEPADLAQVKEFIAHWNKVKAMLTQTPPAKNKKRTNQKKGQESAATLA